METLGGIHPHRLPWSFKESSGLKKLSLVVRIFVDGEQSFPNIASAGSPTSENSLQKPESTFGLRSWGWVRSLLGLFSPHAFSADLQHVVEDVNICAIYFQLFPP